MLSEMRITSAGALQLRLQSGVLLLQEAQLGGQLAGRVQALDVDVGWSSWKISRNSLQHAAWLSLNASILDP